LDEKRPKVFISYSWSSSVHRDKVLEFATQLQELYGVEVIFDEWDLQAGQDKFKFMESCVSDPTITHVLVVCDQQYAIKADKRVGGVGTESEIITPEIYEHSDQTRFVPVVFEYDENDKPYLPVLLKSRMYFDLSNVRNNYNSEMENLVRTLWGKPKKTKPSLASRPDWLEEGYSNLSPLRRLISDYESKPINRKRKESEIITSYIEKTKEICGYQSCTEDNLYKDIVATRELQELFSQFISEKASVGLDDGRDFSNILEKTYNEFFTWDGVDYSSSNDEKYYFLAQENVIRMISIFIYYDRYDYIHDVINHTYFLRPYSNNPTTHACDITGFYHYLSTLEERFKPKSEKARLFSLEADLIISRANTSYCSKENLIFADLFICQMSHCFHDRSKTYAYTWFPITYVYGDEFVNPWYRFISASYCKKAMVAFGCNNIQDMVKLLSENIMDEKVGYNRSFHSVKGVAQWFKPEEIGSKP
jgi:hypothetical protein